MTKPYALCAIVGPGCAGCAVSRRDSCAVTFTTGATTTTGIRRAAIKAFRTKYPTLADGFPGSCYAVTLVPYYMNARYFPFPTHYKDGLYYIKWSNELAAYQYRQCFDSNFNEVLELFI